MCSTLDRLLGLDSLETWISHVDVVISQYSNRHYIATRPPVPKKSETTHARVTITLQVPLAELPKLNAFIAEETR
jgi:hypothetical protein